MRFTILDLFKLTTAAAVLLGLFSVLPPIPVLCIPVAIGYYVYSSSRTDWRAITGAGVGLVLGIAAGCFTDLGLVAIRAFNPSLPPQDFKITFGVIVGAVIGAFVGAVVTGIPIRKPL